ncbi:MAG: PD-(D/E)XK nuclease-like domain-containing protein [Alphaproteobacteria bacterium]
MNPITEAGVYDGIPEDLYHGQLTDTPSLSRSMAVTLVDECPAKAWAESYLNPEHAPERKREFDIGKAAHLALCEPAQFDARVAIIDAADYKTKAAQEARDAAYAAGLTPLLPKQVAMVRAMGEAAMRNAIVRDAMAGAAIERTLVWRDRDTGIWLKARPDIMSATNRAILYDYKTTTSAHPRRFERHAFDQAYHCQAAWYLDAVEATMGWRPETFALIAQEKDPPHLVSVVHYDERAIQAGAIMNRRAIDLFADCLARDVWPGYGAKPVTIGLPGYAEMQFEERRVLGEFDRIRPTKPAKPPRSLQAASDAAQAPL